MKSSRHVKRQLKSVRKLRNPRVFAIGYINIAKKLTYLFEKGLSSNVIDNTLKEMVLRPT